MFSCWIYFHIVLCKNILVFAHFPDTYSKHFTETDKIESLTNSKKNSNDRKDGKRFLEQSNVWEQFAGDIDGEGADDFFGYDVSLSGDGQTLAIGATFNDGVGISSGNVRVLRSNGDNTSWNQIGEDIDGEAAGDRAGFSVSLSYDGNTVAVGAPLRDNSKGRVRVFRLISDGSGLIWRQLGDSIDGTVKYGYVGWSISLSENGDIVAIGGPLAFDVGQVQVFKLSGNESNWSWSWSQQGNDIRGEANFGMSGFCISLSGNGDTVAIGSPLHNKSTGHLRVFRLSNNGSSLSWIKIGNTIDGEAEYDYFGWSTSLSKNGDIVAIGAKDNDANGMNSGQVQVLQLSGDGTSWVNLGNTINGETEKDESGYSVSLSGDGKVLAIGAVLADGINGINSGNVRVFELNDDNGLSWRQLGNDIDGEATDDFFGNAVSLSDDGHILAISGSKNGGIGHVRTFQNKDSLPYPASPITPSQVPTNVPWVVGNATFDIVVGNAFNSSLHVHHTVGDGPDQVIVDLYKYNCEDIANGTDTKLITLSGQKYEDQNYTFSYDIDVTKTLISNSSMVVFEGGKNAGSSKGAIKFCTKVTTILDATFGTSTPLNVAFRKSNFVLKFDLTDNSLSGGSFGVQADTVVDVDVDVEGDYDVEVCQCTKGSFDCVTIYPEPAILQDENVAICLTATSTEVAISNFNLRMSNSDKTYVYEPVMMGSGTWAVNSNSLTTVFEDGHHLRIETFIVQGLFNNNGDENKVSVSGNAYLEFVSSQKTAADSKFNLVGFDMDLNIEVLNSDGGTGGCINSIISVVTSFFN